MRNWNSDIDRDSTKMTATAIVQAGADRGKLTEEGCEWKRRLINLIRTS
jgi:hypothetical protein